MNDHDQLERLIGRELHDRADVLTGVPFGFDEVRGKAVRIRRNRRIGASIAVAAAVGVVIPTVMAVTGSVQADRDLDPALPSPDAPVEVARTTLSLEGLERGDDPAVEYFTPDGVVLPGEGLRELPESYQALVPSEADGGWLALSPSRDEVRYLTEDFEAQGGSSATQALVTDPDRGVASWVAPESGAQTLLLRSTTDPGVGNAWDFPELPVVQPVDLLGDDTVLYQTADTTRARQEIGLAEADGSTVPITGYVKAISGSAATGAFAVQSESRRDGSGCFAVVDSESLREVWETCDYALGAFSPDGRYVLASSSYQSGMGPGTIQVLDAATGDLVATFTQNSRTQITFVGVVWESSETVLAMAYEGTTGTIVRMHVDGTLEETIDPLKVGDIFGDRPMWFGADRLRFF